MKTRADWIEQFNVGAAQKTALDAGDRVLIDDSAAAFVKKYMVASDYLANAGVNLGFGASMGGGDVNKYFQPHGIANGGKFNALNEESEVSCPTTGTITALAWRCAGVLSGAQVRILVNGIPQVTLNLTGTSGVVSCSVNVTAGNTIAVQYFTVGTTAMGKSVLELFVRGVQ